MANAARGEVDIVLAGNTYAIGLNMGALAHIEDKLQIESWDRAFNMTSSGAKKVAAFLEAIIEGNDVALDDAVKKDLRRWSLSEARDFIYSLAIAGGLLEKTSTAPEGGSAPLPVASDGASGSA